MKRLSGAAPVATDPSILKSATEYYQNNQEKIAGSVDAFMGWLLLIEWISTVALAAFFSPRTWNGSVSFIHPHLTVALMMGPLIAFVPLLMVRLYPSKTITRHVVAAAQMIMSGLLIGVTNGRIETHFHVFGSLAVLAFYRDWRVLITASAVTAADHVIRGIWWPESIYGVLNAGSWRWLEHAWWVAFEDVILIVSGRRSAIEMRTIAFREAEMTHGANHDALTGLPNRRLLRERFDAALLAEGARGAVLFVDLDRFKQVNDQLGHTMGDKLLVEIAGRLSAVTPAHCTIGRIGGDEFLMVVRDIDPSDAMNIGESVVRAFSAPFSSDGIELFICASIGISLYPEHGTDLTSLQEKADVAMYAAKAAGRNQCALFSPEQVEFEARRSSLEREIYYALERDQFEVYYQPQVASNGKLKGFEALLRWRHPVFGNVPPTEFIPMAEKSGAIIGIGAWVLSEAIRDCGDWQSHGHGPLTVAVNVSSIQFEMDDFASRVIQLLNGSGFDPSLLTIEITESVLMKDIRQASEHLSKLRAAGIGIALDDFGSGYCNLSYLQSLPADYLKLDRPFVTASLAGNSKMVESIIQMAHRMGLQVVAEGVETARQRDQLRERSCDLIQGYFYGKPVNRQDTLLFLERFADDIVAVSPEPQRELLASCI